MNLECPHEFRVPWWVYSAPMSLDCPYFSDFFGLRGCVIFLARDIAWFFFGRQGCAIFPPHEIAWFFFWPASLRDFHFLDRKVLWFFSAPRGCMIFSWHERLRDLIFTLRGCVTFFWPRGQEVGGEIIVMMQSIEVEANYWVKWSKLNKWALMEATMGGEKTRRRAKRQYNLVIVLAINTITNFWNLAEPRFWYGNNLKTGAYF